MTDLWHETVPQVWRDMVWDAMTMAPQHLFLTLTKRPWNVTKEDARQMPGNVMFGITAEDEVRMAERFVSMPHLPETHLWLSVEPMLGPVPLNQLCWFEFVAVGPETPLRARLRGASETDRLIQGVVDECEFSGIPCCDKRKKKGTIPEELRNLKFKISDRSAK
jgi:protein gp37